MNWSILPGLPSVKKVGTNTPLIFFSNVSLIRNLSVMILLKSYLVHLH